VPPAPYLPSSDYRCRGRGRMMAGTSSKSVPNAIILSMCRCLRFSPPTDLNALCFQAPNNHSWHLIDLFTQRSAPGSGHMSTASTRTALGYVRQWECNFSVRSHPKHSTTLDRCQTQASSVLQVGLFKFRQCHNGGLYAPTRQ
jgi:hypothetical protein